MKLLKDCPCCGSQATFFESESYSSGQDYDDDVGVKCTQCPLTIQFTDYAGKDTEERMERAQKAWNTRP